jgi:hypothetical protein
MALADLEGKIHAFGMSPMCDIIHVSPDREPFIAQQQLQRAIARMQTWARGMLDSVEVGHSPDATRQRPSKARTRAPLPSWRMRRVAALSGVAALRLPTSAANIGSLPCRRQDSLLSHAASRLEPIPQ